jgi:hypothetical protein
MAIPELITSDHIRHAAGEIRKSGVPRARRSTLYDAVVDGDRLPPKYLLSIACRIATGRPLPARDFNGGAEANGFLRQRDVPIIDKEGNPVTAP